MSMFEKEYLRALVKVSNECCEYKISIEIKYLYIYKGLLCLFLRSVFTRVFLTLNSRLTTCVICS